VHLKSPDNQYFYLATLQNPALKFRVLDATK